MLKWICKSMDNFYKPKKIIKTIFLIPQNLVLWIQNHAQMVL
jgi:hypothetical protein